MNVYTSVDRMIGGTPLLEFTNLEKKLGLKAKIVQISIPRMGLYYKNAYEAKAELDEFYTLLNDFDKTMIGGKLPDEGMLYKK